ncbi:hypothetical protein FACS1894204_06740 [Synergistales bacterium]|nr:hypothetical protein FACS1894204_06740 [Synergistales bacterium]
MPTPPTAERPAAEFNFIDKAVPEKVFNAEMRRIDYGQTGIEKTLARIEAKIDKMDAKFEAKVQDIQVDIKDVRFGLNAKFEERFDKVNAKIDNLFYWMIGTMLVFAGLISSVGCVFLVQYLSPYAG